MLSESSFLTLILSPTLELDDNILGVTRLLYRGEQTTEMEFPEYQEEPSRVSIAWSFPENISISGNDISPITRVYITVVAENYDQIRTQLDQILNLSIEELLALHYGAWDQLWNSGFVDVEGDEELEKVVLASQYYLLSSLPNHDTGSEFCGLSPGSLAYGHEARDYQE